MQNCFLINSHPRAQAACLLTPELYLIAVQQYLQLRHVSTRKTLHKIQIRQDDGPVLGLFCEQLTVMMQHKMGCVRLLQLSQDYEQLVEHLSVKVPNTPPFFKLCLHLQIVYLCTQDSLLIRYRVQGKQLSKLQQRPTCLNPLIIHAFKQALFVGSADGKLHVYQRLQPKEITQVLVSQESQEFYIYDIQTESLQDNIICTLALREQSVLTLALNDRFQVISRIQHAVNAMLVIPATKYLFLVNVDSTFLIYSLKKKRVIQKLPLGQDNTLMFQSPKSGIFLIVKSKTTVNIDISCLKN